MRRGGAPGLDGGCRPWQEAIYRGREEEVVKSTEDLFVGELVTGVPPLESQLVPKMPGDADGNDQGDHCG